MSPKIFRIVMIINIISFIITSCFLILKILVDKGLTTMEGKISEYTWTKSIDNYNFFNCHGNNIVFRPKGNNNKFAYSIQFTKEINLEDYKNKEITVQGKEVINTKEVTIDCYTINQRPAGTCEKGNNKSTFTCYSLVNARIVE